jgi:crotonobetainyl-CoA:carnitine CoA-transferase CaiB-like acyl-CoA transferase
MANVAGHDINFVAESGILGLLKDPHTLPFPIADVAAGTFGAVMQIMAALLLQQRCGEGTIIDHNITAFCSALAIPQWVHPGESKVGAAYVLDGHQPNYTVYATQDGHIAVGALEPKFWDKLLKHLELEDPDRETLEAIFNQKTTAEWENELSPLNVCVSPVRVFNDPKVQQLRADSVVLESVTMNGEPVKVPRLPFFC